MKYYLIILLTLLVSCMPNGTLIVSNEDYQYTTHSFNNESKKSLRT